VPELVFRLPDVGEGLTEADIVSWKVRPGQSVAVNDIIVEIETAKSVVELPSPHSGIVAALHHAEGDTVPVGEPIITLVPADQAVVPVTSTPPAPAVPPEPALEDKVEVLVGYGPSASVGSRRRRAAAAPQAVQDAASPALSAGEPRTAPVPLRYPAQLLASPPVRLFARERGVELAQVSPSGGRGQITRNDVLKHASVFEPPPVVAPPVPEPIAVMQDERVTRIPIRGVRKATAAAMVASKFTAPHVTEFLTVDVTDTLELVAQLRSRPAFAGLSVTPLLVVAKALLVAVAENPQINASWSEATGEILQFRDINLGVAAATERGLIVPNIKAAQELSLVELSRALTDLIATARAGRTSPADMGSGTITITNIGSFGVDAGTPILNPGEAAILCMGAVRPVPWVVDGQIVARSVMTLSLAFDHRLVDGDLGSRVLARTGAVLRDPLWELALS
jgi:2-oxoisovalerate dehydrogenase E2 component (dihydrolipoyl transacylase)